MLVNNFKPNFHTLKSTIQQTSAKPIEGFSLGNKLLKANASADTFLAVNKGLQQGIVKSNWLTQNAAKGPLKYFGKFTNALSDMTIKASNYIGNSILKASPESVAGKLISKVPALNKLGTGLSKVSKLPGIATMFIAGEAIWGIGKAIVKGTQGKGKEATHQLIKSGVTLGGQLTGLALLAGGIIASPFTAGTSLAASLAGIGTLIGTDMAGRWAGEKIADKICGPINDTAKTSQKPDAADYNEVILDESINDFINSLYKEPYMTGQTNPFINFNANI
ncbi:MAG: hypothetical protein AB7V50_10275 [Vampirovibrionia bacterium]